MGKKYRVILAYMECKHGIKIRSVCYHFSYMYKCAAVQYTLKIGMDIPFTCTFSMSTLKRRLNAMYLQRKNIVFRSADLFTAIHAIQVKECNKYYNIGMVYSGIALCR